MAQRLSVHCVQHGMASAIGCSAGALRGALAVMRSHATERTLIDFPVFFAAREGQSPMLQFVDGFRRVATEIFDRVLISEPVGAFHRVVHVPAPVILTHIAERSRNSTLRRHGVRTGGKYLRDAC